MAKHAEYCLICARRRRDGEYSCPSCKGDVYGDQLPGTGPAPTVERGTPLRGVLGELLELPPGGLVLMYGAKGIGKSTIAMVVFERCFYGTTEMDPDRIRAYAKRLGVELAGVRVPRLIVEAEETRVDLREDGPVDYVLDSLNATKAPAVALAACRALCNRGGRVIALAQITQDEKIRGGEDLAHDCDVVVRIDAVGGQKRITVEKNRFGPEGARTFRLGPNGAEDTPKDRFYSVEGSAPNYRLEPWPSSSAKYAAVLAEAERTAAEGKAFMLPEPPAAVAAQRSALYSGGWIEPEDWQARAAFAEAAGVPYFSPLRRAHVSDGP